MSLTTTAPTTTTTTTASPMDDFTGDSMAILPACPIPTGGGGGGNGGVAAAARRTSSSSSAFDDNDGLNEDAGLSLNLVIRQDPLLVTLDGPALFGLAVLLIACVHWVDHVVLELTIAALPLLLHVHNDYRNYLALGPGGTPSTFAGYVRIAWFRLWALRDPFSPPEPSSSSSSSSHAHAGFIKGGASSKRCFPERGILAPPPRGSSASLTKLATSSGTPRSGSALPYRAGPRPVVAGIAPQRQVDQRGSYAEYLSLRRTLAAAAVRHSTLLGTARSCLEKHGLALFARHPVNVTCQGEVCHVHDSDRSLHMNLHPDDIAEVLRKGWGQRHPLAIDGVGWWARPSPVRKEFVMVYAPRDEHELRIVCRIIEAAIWFVMAEEIALEPVLSEN